MLSWLWLRGRCADCAAPISPRYPLVELLTAALFGLLTAYLLGIGRGSAVPAYLYLAGVGVALAVIDAEHRRLPNALTLPSYPVLAVLLGVTLDGPALLRAAIGGAVLLAFYGGIAFLVPAAMGWGDVKLSGLLGAALAFLSWPTLAVGAFAAFALGAAYGVALMALGRGTRKTSVPFGPFMVAGALVGILAAPSLADLAAALM